MYFMVLVQLPSAQAATTPTATTGFAPQHAGKTTGTYLSFLFIQKLPFLFIFNQNRAATTGFCLNIR
jgi:hypothetical protein